MRSNLVLKFIKSFFACLSILVITFEPTYSYFQFYYPTFINSGSDIIVIGDSYAGFFASYECYKDYNILVYADAGKSTEENYEMMKDAAEATPSVAFISIGVNDHYKNIPLAEFESRMDEIVSKCVNRGKRVILHTYMNYDLSAIQNNKATVDVKEYDGVLKSIAKKYKRVFYIDMSDYNSEKFLQSDRIHYDRAFYDELYNRLTVALMLF